MVLWSIIHRKRITTDGYFSLLILTLSTPKKLGTKSQELNVLYKTCASYDPTARPTFDMIVETLTAQCLNV